MEPCVKYESFKLFTTALYRCNPHISKGVFIKYFLNRRKQELNADLRKDLRDISNGEPTTDFSGNV